MSAATTITHVKLLKIIWLVHFVLSSWAIMGGYLAGTPAYYYTQLGVLACGMWAIVSPDSIDATDMFLLTLTISIVNDILHISIYQPRAQDTYETPDYSTVRSIVDEYRFALGMSILNLLLKPFSIFLVFCIHLVRTNTSLDFVVFRYFTSLIKPTDGSRRMSESESEQWITKGSNS